jgi:hypothetical protein
MITLFWIFLFIVVYRFLINLVRYLRTKYFLKQYHAWFKEKEWDLVQYRKEVTELFDKAGVEDSTIPVVEPAGYGQIMRASTRLFLNFPSDDVKCANLFITAFHNAIGVYRRRMWQSVNPFWWVELLLYLPANVFKYFGLPFESFITKAFQLTYWFLAVTCGAIIALYPDQVRAKIEQILGLIGKV